jgi:hypothetical protein
MRTRRFAAHVAAGPGGRGVIAVPFDPDKVWGGKAGHPVGGTINGRQGSMRCAHRARAAGALFSEPTVKCPFPGGWVHEFLRAFQISSHGHCRAHSRATNGYRVVAPGPGGEHEQHRVHQEDQLLAGAQQPGRLRNPAVRIALRGRRSARTGVTLGLALAWLVACCLIDATRGSVSSACCFPQLKAMARSAVK